MSGGRPLGGVGALAAGLCLILACSDRAPADAAWARALRTAHEAGTARVTTWPQEIRALRFGAIPYLDPEELRTTFAPLLAHLETRLGVATEMVIATDYGDLGRRMQRQEVDLGDFTPLAYVAAKRRDPGLRPLLRQVAEGSTSYLGYIYAGPGFAGRTLDDLAGRSMCYVDPLSTSGYLYPRALLKDLGHDPRGFFGRTEFGGNHLACMRRVLAGELDAGAAYSGTFSIARRQGLAVDQLTILGKTARIPFDAFCVRSGLPAAAARRLKEELLSLSTRSPTGREILGHGIKLNAWAEGSDRDYDSVRQALAAVGD